MIKYVVARGDTLLTIARTYYNDFHRWSDIAAANGWLVQRNVSNPEDGPPCRLFVGQVINIPALDELGPIPANTIVPKEVRGA